MSTLAAAGRRPPTPRLGSASSSYYGNSDKLGRNVAIALVVVAHLAAGWGLLQLQIVRDTLQEAAPIFVNFIQEQKPVVEAPPPPKQPPRVVQKKTPPPVIAAAPTPTPKPAEYVVAPPPPEPVRDAIVAPEAPPSPPAPPAASSQPAQPISIDESSVAYVRKPALSYPRLSVKLKEKGTVVVRALINTSGRAEQVMVTRTSNYTRLDQEAMRAVREALFKPQMQNGKPIPVWAPITLIFDLED
ncbi:MAG: energy transducer TonB [Rhodocyclaceae bacterium]